MGSLFSDRLKPMNHEELYKLIPSFECKEGCSECCGPMQYFDEYELEQLDEKILPVGFYCPYKTANGCGIYEKRPLICRLFGNLEGLECIYGYGPSQKLTKEEGAAIMEQYNRMGAKDEIHSG